METINCKGCGEDFELTDGEVDYYSKTILDNNRNSPTYGQEIQLQKPKRCPDCRDKRRKNN